jgi:hypothetical protein
MSGRIRLFEPGIVYNVTHRTNNRQFLFRPNHNPGHILLARDCPANALDMSNELVPKPSIINVIGSSYVRAMQKYPVDLYWTQYNINHGHDGIAPSLYGDLGAVPLFYRHAKTLIAKQVNKAWGRQNHVFGGPYRMEPCLDAPALEQKLQYALTNVVKDGLVERLAQSPFLSSFKQLAFGEPMRFWWIDWTRYNKAGGPDRRDLHPKQFLKWGKLELTPLPHWQEWPEHKRQTRVRKMVREIEQAAADRRKAEKSTVIGVPALYQTNPLDKPGSQGKRGPQPLCHASDRELRRMFREKWSEFRDAYKVASYYYREGDYYIAFPEGSFRPPLISIYTASAL